MTATPVQRPDSAGRPVPVRRADVERAAARIARLVRRTPVIQLDPAITGQDWGGRLSIKLESLQLGGSFKARGAFNHVLGAPSPPTGIVAASGGNHAVAAAIVGRTLGVRTEIYLPATTPRAKLAAVQATGATVISVGRIYDDAAAAARQRQQQTGWLLVPPYEHPRTIAGQGTAFRELAEDAGVPAAVLVAVGGGGLIAGCAAALGAGSAIIAVEPERCPAFARAFAAGRPVDAPVGGYAADGLGGSRIGEVCFATAAPAVSTAVLVSDDDIRTAQATLWRELRMVAEPAGATAFAALTSGSYRPAAGEHVALLICGANTDPAELPVGRPVAAP